LALNGNGSSLNYLEVVGSDFIYEGPGLNAIASALRTNTSLTHFQFQADPGNFGGGSAFVDEMQQVLRVDTTLTDLNLRCLEMNGDGDGDVAMAMAMAMPRLK
jgi:hypothetical protein